MLDTGDVQERVSSTEGPVEVGLVPGIAAEDLHTLPIEPRDVGAILTNEAADFVPLGQQELQQATPEEARGPREEDSHAGGTVFPCRTELAGRFLLILAGWLLAEQLHDGGPVDLVHNDVPDLGLLALFYVSQIRLLPVERDLGLLPDLES
jgi:hypothetical protein